MRVTSEDWKNGWEEVEIGISKNEIGGFIEMLKMLESDPEQHFHISSDYKAKGGIGKVTFYVKTDKEQDNMVLGSKALFPGDEIPASVPQKN
jgi:hypothetical protein